MSSVPNSARRARVAPSTGGRDDTGKRDYYSVAQAAALLGVSRVTIWRWIRAGDLPVSRLGHRTVRIKRHDLEHLLVAGANSGARSWVFRRTAAGVEAADGTDGAMSVPQTAWHNSAASDGADGHIVQFYEADAFLLDTVAEYIGAALRTGGVGVAIATRAHHEGLEQRLRAGGLDVDGARRDGRYVTLDAADLLARIMADGAPDPARFEKVVGGVIARAVEGQGRVHCFGELVALLAAAGNHAAAIGLEEMWNDLRRRHTFTLFCGYPLVSLAGESLSQALGDICAAHSAVIPAESYTALPSPEDRLRAIALLQQKARSLEAEVTQRKEGAALLDAQARVLEMIATGAPLADVLAALVRVIEEQADGLLCSILVRDPAHEQFALGIAPSLPDSYIGALVNAPIAPPYLGPCSRAAHSGEEVSVADIASDERWAEEWRQLAMSHGLRTCYAVPICAADGSVLGSFGLYYRTPRAPRPANAQLVETATHLAGIAIERYWAEEALRIHTRQAQLGAAIGVALTSGNTLQAQLQRCAEAIVEHLDAAFARIWTLDEGSATLVLRASAGLYTHLDGPHGRVPLGALKIGRIASEKRPHLTNSVIGDPHVSDQAWAAREGMVAFAGYPLVVEDRLVGVVALFARHTLTDTALGTLGAVADEIALGIARAWADEERAQLLRHERAAREEIATINRVGRLLSAELDQEKLVQAITDAATDLTGAQFGAFFYNVTDELGDSYLLYTLSGAPKEAFANFPPPRNSALFGPTFRGEGIVRLDDVHRDPRFGQNPPYHGLPPGHLPVVSYLAVPVVARSGEVLGGLFFGHPEAGRFTEREERIVAGLAAQAAIAMDNARLYQQVRETLHLREEFLSSATHDLKTPLTSIRGQAQLARLRLARRTASNVTAIAEQLEEIEAATGRMTRLVDSISDLTRARMGGAMELNRQPVDLVALIGSVVARFTKQNPQRITLDAAVPALTLTLDAERIERVVDNLLSNAVKYSPDDSAIIVCVAREDGADGADGAAALLTVRDQGIGIAQADLPHVFERFHRAAGVRTRVDGSGVGLASAEQIVRQHGGTICVQSQEGEGSTFTVRLPLTPATGETENRA